MDAPVAADTSFAAVQFCQPTTVAVSPRSWGWPGDWSVFVAILLQERTSISSPDSAPQTLTEHLAWVERGEWTATQATAHALQRVRELDADLRAWVELSAEAALERAAELDSLSPTVRRSLPLFGVPVGVKDLFDLAGRPTGCGSARLRAGPPATGDAALVAMLRKAGGVILGKTVTTHFACFDPPATINPWDAQRTPGGSSSGSAVAVATGMCLPPWVLRRVGPSPARQPSVGLWVGSQRLGRSRSRECFPSLTVWITRVPWSAPSRTSYRWPDCFSTHQRLGASQDSILLRMPLRRKGRPRALDHPLADLIIVLSSMTIF